MIIMSSSYDAGAQGAGRVYNSLGATNTLDFAWSWTNDARCNPPAPNGWTPYIGDIKTASHTLEWPGAVGKLVFMVNFNGAAAPATHQLWLSKINDLCASITSSQVHFQMANGVIWCAILAGELVLPTASICQTLQILSISKKANAVPTSSKY